MPPSALAQISCYRGGFCADMTVTRERIDSRQFVAVRSSRLDNNTVV